MDLPIHAFRMFILPDTIAYFNNQPWIERNGWRDNSNLRHELGFPESLHRGFVAVLLDSAMTNCMFAHGLVGVTGELKVRSVMS